MKSYNTVRFGSIESAAKFIQKKTNSGKFCKLSEVEFQRTKVFRVDFEDYCNQNIRELHY